MGINWFCVDYEGGNFQKKGLGLLDPSPEMVAVQGLEPRTPRIRNPLLFFSL
jgi:hypothetical protein